MHSRLAGSLLLLRSSSRWLAAAAAQLVSLALLPAPFVSFSLLFFSLLQPCVREKWGSRAQKKKERRRQSAEEGGEKECRRRRRLTVAPSFTVRCRSSPSLLPLLLHYSLFSLFNLQTDRREKLAHEGSTGGGEGRENEKEKGAHL